MRLPGWSRWLAVNGGDDGRAVDDSEDGLLLMVVMVINLFLFQVVLGDHDITREDGEQRVIFTFV